MPEVASKIVWVTPTTHERLVAIKEAEDLASFDRLIMRALDAWESRGCNKKSTDVPPAIPEPPQNAATAP